MVDEGVSHKKTTISVESVVKDLSRGRAYIGGEMVAKRGVPVFATVEEAIEHIVESHTRLRLL